MFLAARKFESRHHASAILGSYQIWQYGLSSFQAGGIKLERILPKNQHTQRKFSNFESWTNGEPE